VISNVVYQLALPTHWKIHNVFHTSLLTPYHETAIHGPNYHEPPPDVIDGEPEWEVEQVTGSRRFGRKKELQYRVRWKGYSAAHDSWEPVKNVHAPELVEAFLKRTVNGHKRTGMGDEALPARISLITMNPDTTSQQSRPPSPEEGQILWRILSQAGINFSLADSMRLMGEEPTRLALAHLLTTPSTTGPSGEPLVYPITDTPTAGPSGQHEEIPTGVETVDDPHYAPRSPTPEVTADTPEACLHAFSCTY
jgi:hypothetical protein